MTTLALSFNDVNFSPVQQDGQIWLTAGELARALGYAKANAVTQVYERNQDEFNSSMTNVIDLNSEAFVGSLNLRLPKKENNLVKTVRIFSLRGAHLIAMFSKTAIAKQFRKWVLDILDKEVTRKDTQQSKITKEERAPINDAVNMLVAKTKHLNFSDAYKLVHQRFNVDRIEDIPYQAIPVAVEYVHHLIALYSDIERHQPPKNKIWHDQDVQLLMWYVPKLAKLIRDEIYPALTAMRSEYAGRLIGLSQETVCHANTLNGRAIKAGMTCLEHLDNKPVHTLEWYWKK